MQKYTLFMDTNCDVTPKHAQDIGCKLILMPYEVEGKVVYPYRDFDEFNWKEFYTQLRNGVMPKTFALSPLEYYDYFKPEFAAGNDILYVHFSAKTSSTFNAMRLALEMLKEEFPERQLYTIDTKATTLGALTICLEIGKLYKQGKSIQEIMSWADQEVDHFAAYFFADDLKFFARSGRIPKFAATMGGLVGLKPIISMTEDGSMVVKAKVPGRKNTLNKILSYVESLQLDMKNYTIVLGQNDEERLAQKFEQALRDKFGDDLQFEYCVTNPTIGSHCGPGGVGISFHAIHR